MGTLQVKGGTRGSGGIPWVQAPSRQLAAGVWLGPSPLCSSPPPLPRTLRPRTASTPTRPVRMGWKNCHWGGRRLCRSARPPWPPRAVRPHPAARMCPRYVRALLPSGLASALPRAQLSAALNLQGCRVMPGGWGGPLPCWTPIPCPLQHRWVQGWGLGTSSLGASGALPPAGGGSCVTPPTLLWQVEKAGTPSLKSSTPTSQGDAATPGSSSAQQFRPAAPKAPVDPLGEPCLGSARKWHRAVVLLGWALLHGSVPSCHLSPHSPGPEDPTGSAEPLLCHLRHGSPRRQRGHGWGQCLCQPSPRVPTAQRGRSCRGSRQLRAVSPGA